MLTIANYGLGNIRAYANIYASLGLRLQIASDAETLARATKIILPGVGAFDQAIERLTASGMRTQLNLMVVEQKVPVLGVCVGMQMMALRSEEGTASGLGWLNAGVRRLSNRSECGRVRLPHMGWNSLSSTRSNPLLEGIGGDAEFYFLHSFYIDCEDPLDVMARTEYGGEFACAVARGNVFGVQFHPEKSHTNGLRLLQNFARI